MIEAEGVKVALAALAQRRFALVCLDLMLPESSGYELCAQIRKMPGLEALPVLIVSSRSLPLDRAIAEEAGSSAYLIKPVRWKVFAATVKQLVDGT